MRSAWFSIFSKSIQDRLNFTSLPFCIWYLQAVHISKLSSEIGVNNCYCVKSNWFSQFCGSIFRECLWCYLFEQVYGLAAHSLEDLPAASPTIPSGDESMTSIEHWGSLQDLARMDQGRQRRRRKHLTHHQHPMPPPLLAPRAHSPVTAPDDESDVSYYFFATLLSFQLK